MPLYHAAPLTLAPGSSIMPGNWGRIIRAIGVLHNRWNDELVLEDVRKTKFPNLPSRFEACFTCPTEEILRYYVKHAGGKGNPCPPVLYEVEKADQNAVEHLTDFNLITANKPGETMAVNAERYWQGNFYYTITNAPGMRCEEILTTSPLRIVRKLD